MLTVRLDQVSVSRVEGTVISQRPHQPEPQARITIAIANLPAPALEQALSRCTEAAAYAFAISNRLIDEPSSFWNAFTLQPGSTTITDSGRHWSSAPRARIASMMRFALARVSMGYFPASVSRNGLAG